MALLAAAWRADIPWFERHVLVPFYYMHPAPLPWILRALVVAVGFGLLALARRPLLERLWWRARGHSRTLGWSGVAVLAALGASELALRVARRKPPTHLKVSVRDGRLGWRSRPSSTTVLHGGKGLFRYVIDSNGHRARSETAASYGAAPTLLVAGESIAAGFGLDWDDTFAVRCGRALRLPVVDAGDLFYAADQTYLRVVEELGRQPAPVAVVVVFVPSEMGRLLRDDRPRLLLDARGLLEPVPAASGFLARSALRDIVVNHLPYASDRALARAQRSTAALLRATAAAARARGAAPLFVIPSPGPPRAFDERPEASLLRALFVEPGLPHVVVDLDETLLIPGDGHPNRAGAARLAQAVEAALQL